MKKIILTGFLFIFLPIMRVHANVIFTEIMYDPSGSDDKHEWVEIYNDGSSSVDVTKYFLQTDGTGSSYHSISSVTGSGFLSGNTYAVIAQDSTTFKSDYPQYAGNLFDSSWSDLSNSSGKTLVINDTNKIALDQYVYNPTTNVSGDGSSIQKNSSGVWVSALATPGSAFNGASGEVVNSSGGLAAGDIVASSTQNNISTSTIISQPVNLPQINITLSQTVIVGTPVTFAPHVMNVKNIAYGIKSMHATFGDGGEYYDYPEVSFEHVYDFPGTYVVSIEYLPSPYNKNDPGKLFFRKNIEVVSSPISIRDIDVDGSVKIANSGLYDADLSGWILRSLSKPDKIFVLPDNTFIVPNNSVMFSKNSTGLTYEDFKRLELTLPSGLPVSVYDDLNKNNLVATNIEADVMTHKSNMQNSVVVQKSVSVSKRSKTAIAAMTLSEDDVSNTNDNENQDNKNNLVSHYSNLNTVLFGVGVIGIIIVSVFIVKSLHREDREKNISADEIRIIDD